MGPEHRTHRRLAWHQPAVIVSLLGGRLSTCMVKDISPSGACLLVDAPQAVPKYFRLNYGDLRVEPKCAVRWREGREVGVQFVP
jgi:hypothetical protein